MSKQSCARLVLILICLALFILDLVYLTQFLLLRDGYSGIAGMVICSLALAALLTSMSYMK